MEKRVLIIVLFFSLQHIINAQQSKNPLLWKTFISIGYSDATPGKLYQYYDLIVDSYTSTGIPIQRKTEFGRTLMLSGGFLLSRVTAIWVGLSFGYLYSPAYANYKDYFGTLKVNGFVNSYEIAVQIKAELFRIKTLPIFISVQPGMAYATASINEEIKYFDEKDNYNREWSKYSWGPAFKSTISSSIYIGDFALIPEVGYRFAYNKVSSENLELPLQMKYETMDFGQYGIIFLLTLERQF